MRGKWRESLCLDSAVCLSKIDWYVTLSSAMVPGFRVCNVCRPLRHDQDPAALEARKIVLDNYVQSLLEVGLGASYELCEFLSDDSQLFPPSSGTYHRSAVIDVASKGLSKVNPLPSPCSSPGILVAAVFFPSRLIVFPRRWCKWPRQWAISLRGLSAEAVCPALVRTRPSFL